MRPKRADIGTAAAAVAMFMDHHTSATRRTSSVCLYKHGHSHEGLTENTADTQLNGPETSSWVPAGFGRTEFESMHRWVLHMQHKHYGYCQNVDGAN